MEATAKSAKNIFIELIRDVPQSEWNAHLTQICDGDHALAHRVNELLSAHLRTGNFLEQPAFGVDVTGDHEPEPPGTTIGPYTLLERIGEGGMGTVYMAEQTQPVSRRVAVKVIKLGMDTGHVVARFDTERQALALMDHANIARVFDAGATDTGRPYFVMELVRGIPITDYADREHLSIRERLTLFVLVCRAVQHAHQKGIIHRDLKPSNVMVALIDGVAVPKIIDFGVAKATGGQLAERTLVTGFAQLVGTPLYMSPEQADPSGADVDTRSDIYTLGILLYELLTGTTPIDADSLAKSALDKICRMITEYDPPTPSKRLGTLGETLTAVSKNRGTDARTLGGYLRGELDWITMRAMEKDRNRRYESASAFAADVMRHLTDERVEACPSTVMYRLGKFIRRNRAVLTAACLVILALATGAAASAWQAVRATQAEQGSRYESLVQRLIRLQLTPHGSGWSDEALGLVQGAANLRTNEERSLRDRAAARLIGVDARRIKTFSTPATNVSFDPGGRRLFMGGAEHGLRIWHPATGETDTRELITGGPFAFRADGTALQLGAIADSKGGRPTLQLWDLAEGHSVQRFELPGGEKAVLRAYALSRRGTHVAAVSSSPDAETVLTVWSTATRGVLLTIPCQGCALAFSHDAELLGAGDEDGHITVWALPEGRTIAELPAGHAAIRCLALRRDAVQRTRSASDGWLLAAGDEGGTVTIWDLQTKIPRSLCHGSQYGVNVVAFSPDEMTVASAGRETVKLWDLATGRLLLDVGKRNSMTDLDFSPDGKRLAVSSLETFGPGGVDVWDLEDGRGVQTLRGLAGPVAKVGFSPDGRLLAALAHDWRIALFDLESRRLRFVIEAPKGTYADSAALAFNRGGTRFAFAAGTEAGLWDTRSGQRLKTWDQLPVGLVDHLAFHPAGKLLLFRVETRDPGVRPYGTDPRKHPRVCRIRDLLADQPCRAIAEIDAFNHRVYGAAAAPDGSFFVADGRGGPDGEKRTIRSFDGLTGVERWSITSGSTADGTYIALDPSGRILAVYLEGSDRGALVDAASGRLIAPLKLAASVVAPEARFRGTPAGEPPYGFLLHKREADQSLITLGIENRVTSVFASFDEPGRHLAWGNADGTVFIADLNDIQRSLAAVRLGW